jgi:molybdenum cofactor guanylyltransferase
MRLGAIILAGGRSTRMGRPKESLLFAGETLLARACATVAACAAPIVVVARDAAQVLPPLPAGVQRTNDAAPDRGPLVGLAAGLAWLRDHGGMAADDAAFAVACDQPFLTVAGIRALANELGDNDVVMAQIGGFVQPLGAIYRLSVAATITGLLRQGVVSPRTLASVAKALILDETRLRAIDPELAFWRSVDTPDDYERARRPEP